MSRGFGPTFTKCVLRTHYFECQMASKFVERCTNVTDDRPSNKRMGSNRQNRLRYGDFT